MINALKKLFKIKSVDYKQLIKEGAVIIDVRSPQEFDSGHIRPSKNLPLPDLPHRLMAVPDKNKTYITVCASGMRSASAKSLMKRNGYENVYNGGGWKSLQSKI
jgi:rhodanese-related sulfurtransferase